MPFPLAAGIGLQAGASLLGGLFGDDAAEERARAYEEARNALGAGRQQAVDYLTPRLNQERAAMDRVSALLGLGGAAPDYDLFRATPGYEFMLEEGSRARERSAAARGGLNSGNTLLALEEYGQGLADTTFNNYLSTVLGLQNQGVDRSLGDLSYTYGTDVGNLALGAGEARASGAESWGNSLVAGMSGISDLLGARSAQNTLRDIYAGGGSPSPILPTQPWRGVPYPAPTPWYAM